ncbi:slipin family protein [Prochlorothrix hollandica]|uniref:slipin family protein n=1 Tax=Prochlorothrix hollandica TaxID=1223 RepID=UPI00034580AC|nr:slipin family protein [Prochlorothrix hollandica]
MPGLIGFLVLAIVSSLFSGFKVDREYQRGVIFRLGRFHKVKGPGLYWTVPLVDEKVRVDVRTKTVDIKPQETVTADSVTIKVNAVLYYRILDPDRAINRVESYEKAVYEIAMTTLRNVVGQNILDNILQNRDMVNDRVQDIVDEVTEPWGVVVERVEIKDVEIPLAMQRAMAKEAEAVREKRARIIKATAEQESAAALAEAAQSIAANPSALELRRLQMLTEIGAENNTTTLLMMPSDFMNLAQAATALLQQQTTSNLTLAQTQITTPDQDPVALEGSGLPAIVNPPPQPARAETFALLPDLTAMDDLGQETEEEWLS